MSTTTVHELEIPAALIDWGKAEAPKWRRPWAHMLEDACKTATLDTPLEGGSLETMLSRLEALCAEAVKAGRSDLLLGLDLLTAEWLELRYTLVLGGTKRVTVGPGCDWTYQELRVFLGEPDPVVALERAEGLKALLSGVFPSARIDAMIDPASLPCAGCGTVDSMVWMTLEGGDRYCSPCWGYMTSKRPAIIKRGKKKRA